MNRIDAPSSKEMFKKCIDELNDAFGRVDPLWSEVNMLIRGDLSLPIQGGPDTLRAVYGRPHGVFRKQLLGYLVRLELGEINLLELAY